MLTYDKQLPVMAETALTSVPFSQAAWDDQKP